MKSFFTLVKNQDGSALLITIMALMTMTVLGLIAMKNSTTELTIAGNERQAKLAFFTAESARGYVIGHGELYNDTVITNGSADFPDDTDDFTTLSTGTNQYIQSKDPDGDGTFENYFCLDYPSKCTQMFRGTITYRSTAGTSRQPPEGSGWAYGSYSANVYAMNCEGYFDPSGTGNVKASKNVEQGFFRLGLSGGSAGISF